MMDKRWDILRFDLPATHYSQAVSGYCLHLEGERSSPIEGDQILVRIIRCSRGSDGLGSPPPGELSSWIPRRFCRPSDRKFKVLTGRSHE